MPARDLQSGPTETVLVLGHYRTSLTVCRLLGQAGHTVIAGRSKPTSAEKSRYVTEVWQHPPADNNTEEFIASLTAFLAKRPDITLLLPVAEFMLQLIIPHQESIPTKVACNDRGLIKACTDKAAMLELAQELRVPVPTFEIAKSKDALTISAEKIGFPCVVKPAANIPTYPKIWILRDQDDLDRQFQPWPKLLDTLIVEPWVGGIRFNRYFIAKAGKILQSIDVRIARTHLPDGSGYAVEGISVADNPLMDSHCDALMQSLEYNGIGCIQFLVDEAAGKVSFLEINARLPGNYAFAHYCGLDQLGALIDMTRGREATKTGAMPTMRYGKRFSWLYGDLTGMMAAANLRQISPKGALTWSARAILATIRADKRLTMDWRDPKPNLYLGYRFVDTSVRFLLLQALKLGSSIFHRLRQMI